MVATPRPRPVLVEAPSPYSPREDRVNFLRLDLNEDLSGPLVRRGMPRGAAPAMYPGSHSLNRALAARFRVPEDWVRVTAGADEGIHGLLRAFLDPGDVLLLPWPTFSEYLVAAWPQGARVERALYGADLAFPLAAFREGLAQRPKIAVLVTPANPTGEWMAPAMVLELVESAPQTLFIVDEAYAEFGDGSILDMGPPPPHVAVLRTFSKAYGLAGARVGYVIAHPPVLEAMRQVLPSFSLAGPSLALAEVGLQSLEALKRRVKTIEAGQRRVAAWGERHGLRVHRTRTNFVLFRLRDTAQAKALAAALEARGVLVSDRTDALAGVLRVAIGMPRHVSRLLEALEGAWDDANGE